MYCWPEWQDIYNRYKKLVTLIANLLGIILFRRWVTRKVARLLAKAALRIRIQTSLKNTKWPTKTKEWRQKQRSGQHTLARQKIKIKITKYFISNKKGTRFRYNSLIDPVHRHFSVLQNAIHEQTRVSHIFCLDFKSQE